jgi:hypothetical protein
VDVDYIFDTNDRSRAPANPQASKQFQFVMRECPRTLWQSDSHASKCSMMLCDTRFAPVSSSSSAGVLLSTLMFSTERRHHCRQCGRVVCSRCSTGVKHMLPATSPSAASRPRPVRVCDACLNSGETFHFRPARPQPPAGPGPASRSRAKPFASLLSASGPALGAEGRERVAVLTRASSMPELLARADSDPVAADHHEEAEEEDAMATAAAAAMAAAAAAVAPRLLRSSSDGALAGSRDDDRSSQADTPLLPALRAGDRGGRVAAPCASMKCGGGGGGVPVAVQGGEGFERRARVAALERDFAANRCGRAA